MSADPPSYQESLSAPDPVFPESQAPPHASRLHVQLTSIRTAHIRKIITDSVLPLIHHRAAIGLSQTNIALIPAAIPSSTSNDPQTAHQNESKIDFLSTKLLALASHTDEDLQQLPLTAPMDTTRFWAQSIVVEELRRLLGHRLANEGYGAWSTANESEKQSAELEHVTSSSLPPPTAPRPKPRNLFSRRDTSSTQRQTQVQTVKSQQSTSTTNRIDVQVTPDDVCLRTQSAFGLYETLTRPALIVRVDIRG